MIRVVDGLPEGVLGFRASGKLTAHDYTDVLAPALEAASAGGGRIRVLLDFTGEFDGMEGGAVWQDMRDGRARVERLGAHRPGHRPRVDARRPVDVRLGRAG